MKTLILLTAVESTAEIIRQLPALSQLTDTYYPGILCSEGQPGSYPLLFSRYAREYGKVFYVYTAKNDRTQEPDGGFPQNFQGVDCLILDLTSDQADFSEIDGNLRELFSNLEEEGEPFRLLLLCVPVLPVNSDSDPLSEPEDGPDTESAAEEAPGTFDLPFLYFDGNAAVDPAGPQNDVPSAPVDADALCRLLFLGVESDDLDSIYEDNDTHGNTVEKKSKKSIFAEVFDWVEIFCVALVGVVLLMTFFVRRSPVEGSSMYPTLIGHNSAAIAATDPEHGVEKGYDDLLISNLFYSPHRQDIVIIQEPSQLSEPIVKRIIGISGDKIKIDFDRWEVYVNGELLDEPYVNKKDYTMGSQLLKTDENNCWEGTVPEGCIFVLGDNRAISKDSRSFGFIDERYIIGKVIFRISPFERFGKVEN